MIIMDRRQFEFKSNYLAGELEKEGYTMLLSVASIRNAGIIHMYAVNPEQVLTDVEFHAGRLERLRERRLESMPSAGKMLMDYIADIMMPYSICVPAGFIMAEGDYRGLLAGAAVATLFSFYAFMKQNVKISDYMKDLVAREHYNYWLKNFTQPDSLQSPRD